MFESERALDWAQSMHCSRNMAYSHFIRETGSHFHIYSINQKGAYSDRFNCCDTQYPRDDGRTRFAWVGTRVNRYRLGSMEATAVHTTGTRKSDLLPGHRDDSGTGRN